MKRNFLKYSVMTVFSILILLISSLFLGNLSTKSSIQKTRLYSSTKEYSEYKQQIQSLGGAQAYHKFKKKNQLLKTTAQHNSAHVFGEALYSSLGLKGITICDDDFNYGCYHSVIGNTLGREGLDKIEEINEECATTNEFLKCQHGIGHGIVTYLGYDSDNLKQSLEICDTLKNRDHIGGCFTGVFMEYNFQTMLSEDAKIRNFDKEAPLSPCDTLPTNFQDPCLFEQANWWLQVLPGDLTQKITRIDQYCRDLSVNQHEACYTGLGVHYPTYTNWDPKVSIDGCLSLIERSSQLLCIYGVASDFSSRSEYLNQAKEICNRLKPDEKIACSKRSGLI
jgi:hypothetical protein